MAIDFRLGNHEATEKNMVPIWPSHQLKGLILVIHLTIDHASITCGTGGRGAGLCRQSHIEGRKANVVNACALNLNAHTERAMSNTGEISSCFGEGFESLRSKRFPVEDLLQKSS